MPPKPASTSQKDKDQKGPNDINSTASANKEETHHKKCGDENNRSTSKANASNDSVDKMARKSASSEGSELLKFGSMLSDSITELKNTLAGKFEQLEQTLTQPDLWEHTGDGQDDLSASGTDSDGCDGHATGDEPPTKKSKPTASVETTSKQKVLSTIAEKMQMQEKVDPGIDAQLSEMINQLMFKKEKPDEDKLKEKLGLITRPANCNSLVTTKVDELIWQRLRPQTRSFGSRAQVAQTCVVKSVTILAKMLDKALNLKEKLPDLTTSGDNTDVLQKEIDGFVSDGMAAIETMSFANYEINARRRECIKPDLNDDYMSLFSASVPINQFLFGGDTSKRLEDIEKTNKVVRKAMVHQSSYPRQRHYKGNGMHRTRGRGQRPHTSRQGYTQRHFLGKRPFPYGSQYQKPQKGGAKGKEPKSQ